MLYDPWMARAGAGHDTEFYARFFAAAAKRSNK